MSERFFVEPPIEGDRAWLEDAEAHHLLHVMRGQVGDRVVLFDGSGTEYVGRVEQCRRNRVEVVIVAREAVDRELPFPLVLGVALPKGDRQRWLVEKCVELGVTRLVPLVTRRGVAQAKSGQRLGRAVIEGSKQCGRNVLMQIAQPKELTEFLESGGQYDLRAICHPGGVPLASCLPASGVERGACAAIGPEGGFHDEEIDAAARHRWQVVNLGARVLRTETAALALAAGVTILLKDRRQS
jgi:16S rRNA (uracil1498-N3)-methyltransferase